MNRHRRFLVEISFTINCDLIAIRGLLQRQSGHAEIDQLAFRQLIFTQPRARDHRRTLLRYLRKRAQRLQKNHLQTQKKRRDAFRRRSVFHICTSVEKDRCGVKRTAQHRTDDVTDLSGRVHNGNIGLMLCSMNNASRITTLFYSKSPPYVLKIDTRCRNRCIRCG